MPYILIKVTNKGLSKEKKEQLISGATDLMVNILGKDPKTTFVLIEEVNTDNWGVEGVSVTQREEFKSKNKMEIL